MRATDSVIRVVVRQTQASGQKDRFRLTSDRSTWPGWPPLYAVMPAGTHFTEICQKVVGEVA